MSTRIFKIDERPVTKASWGDYGHILQHGMSGNSSRDNDLLQLERTGPYVPPISLPEIGDVVLTSASRQLLESSGLTGFSFRPIKKALTVELHWETWDWSADEPEHFPESGEPEDYILGQPDSPSASAALGDLWEVVVPATATIRRHRRIVNSYKELQLDLSTWNGADLFRSAGYGSILFTERARDWFVEKWGDYVEFDEFPTT
jgi:hypothetical protein